MVEPTGATHEVGVEDLFFSVTDHNGVIRQANSVFVRLSHFDRQQLIGSPHNIIRHPGMPGGVFKMMWDELLQGKPFVGYIHNLSADGSRYDVFATVTPLADGGYLSVRSRPLMQANYDAIQSLYEATVDLEHQLRSEGVSKAVAAARGADHMAGLLADADLGTYEELMTVLLPEEMSALEESLGGLPDRPDGAGPLREMLDELRAVYDELTDAMVMLDQLSALTKDMRDGAGLLQEAIDRSGSLAGRISAQPDAGSTGEPVDRAVRSWAGMGANLDALLHSLMGEMGPSLMADMTAVKKIAARSRFLIALARLHEYMAGYFIVELLDDAPGTADALPAIVELCEALAAGIDELEEHAPDHREATGRAGHRIQEAAELLEMPAEVMTAWRAGAAGLELPATMSDMLTQVEAEFEASRNAVDQLRGISERSQEIKSILDTRTLRERVARIRELAQGLIE